MIEPETADDREDTACRRCGAERLLVGSGMDGLCLYCWRYTLETEDSTE